MSSKAQLIIYGNLSHKYIYKIDCVKKAGTITAGFRDSKIELYVFAKTGKRIQKITFDADFLYEDVFRDRKNSRSYITGKNENAEVPDYDFGDLVIADLNFDGREDIALKHDSGGNGGPFYNFYLQGTDGLFYKSDYLTAHVGSFPKHINFKQKILITQIHANVHQEGRKTFKYNTKTKKWRLIEWVDVEDNPLYYKNNPKHHHQNNKKSI